MNLFLNKDWSIPTAFISIKYSSTSWLWSTIIVLSASVIISYLLFKIFTAYLKDIDPTPSSGMLILCYSCNVCWLRLCLFSTQNTNFHFFPCFNNNAFHQNRTKMWMTHLRVLLLLTILLQLQNMAFLLLYQGAFANFNRYDKNFIIKLTKEMSVICVTVSPDRQSRVPVVCRKWAALWKVTTPPLANYRL